MKKIILLGFMTIFLLGLVYAQPSCDVPGSIDHECQCFGFDFGVAKWQCEEEGFYPQIRADVTVLGDGPIYWWLEEPDVSSTSVTGNCNDADWDVGSSGATGIVVKAGNSVHYSDEGTSGNVQESQPATSHITFCGDDDPDIPEFGVIGALAVLGLAALYVYRKR